MRGLRSLIVLAIGLAALVFLGLGWLKWPQRREVRLLEWTQVKAPDVDSNRVQRSLLQIDLDITFEMLPCERAALLTVGKDGTIIANHTSDAATKLLPEGGEKKGCRLRSTLEVKEVEGHVQVVDNTFVISRDGAPDGPMAVNMSHSIRTLRFQGRHTLQSVFAGASPLEGVSKAATTGAARYSYVLNLTRVEVQRLNGERLLTHEYSVRNESVTEVTTGKSGTPGIAIRWEYVPIKRVFMQVAAPQKSIAQTMLLCLALVVVCVASGCFLNERVVNEDVTLPKVLTWPTGGPIPKRAVVIGGNFAAGIDEDVKLMTRGGCEASNQEWI